MTSTAVSNKISYPKAVAIALMGIYGLVCTIGVEHGSFLDRVDLIAHEAG